MRTPHSKIFLALVLAIGLLGPSAASAKLSADIEATLPTTASNYYDMGPCTETLTTFCVETFQIDLNGDGTPEEPSDSLDITLHAWLFNLQYDMPGLGWEILVGGQQELSPTIAVGTKARVRINTGNFQPTAKLLSQAEVGSYSVTLVEGAWVTAVDFSTSDLTFSLNCTVSSECVVTPRQIDYASYAQGTMFWEDPSPTTQAQRNMWVSTNASTIYELQFDRETLTWSVILVAPMKKKDGSPNLIRYTTFIPDTAIAYSYGTTPDLLTKYLSVTRVDYDVTREVKATISRVTDPVPGVVISIPDIRVFGKVVEKSSTVNASSSSFTTRPKILIKPKISILAAPKGVRASVTAGVARLKGQRVSGAVRYQAMCSRGSVVIFGSVKRVPDSTVSGLSKGRWRCQLRARGKLAGNWSAPVTVVSRNT